MPHYVDGFVLPLPKKSIPVYRKMSKLAAKVWTDHGALDYRECVGDDLAVPFGMPFPKLVKPKRGETIVFAWITYKSKAERNRVNAAVMKDPRMKCDPKSMPFDCERMSCGGFKTMVGK